MQVLVTGASGHVGAAIAGTLSRAGVEVIGLSRSKPQGVEMKRHLQVDIGDPEAMQEAAAELDRCDGVVHCAARLDREPLALPLATVNCLGTQTTLHAARELGAQRFVYISGVNVIGLPRSLPITEDHPTAPATQYYATKLCGEHLVASAAETGISGVTLRLSSPGGPGLPEGRIMSTFVRQALANERIILHGEGTRRQNYVDVRDVGDAVLSALEGSATGVFNVAGAETLSNRELAETCVQELGSSSEITNEGTDPEDGLTWEVSIERARQELGWRPRLGPIDSIAAVAAEIGGSSSASVGIARAAIS